MQKRWSTKTNKNLTDKQTTNSVGNNDTITPPYQTDKHTRNNKQYTIIDKYSSLSEEEIQEKKRLKFNSDMINNNI
jgi:hypothetical protein